MPTFRRILFLHYDGDAHILQQTHGLIKILETPHPVHLGRDFALQVRTLHRVVASLTVDIDWFGRNGVVALKGQRGLAEPPGLRIRLDQFH
mmetsp:Transcript_38761/g.39146  ORF Transcript_38761/g.39146 Transcript_38761/m.39146 type:complete len:91 (-) Transcript_38761:22-294(-)